MTVRSMSTQPYPLDFGGYCYRPIHPEHDLPALCRLFETVFGHATTVEHWHWKYQQAPAGNHCAIVAEHCASKRIVGHIGSLILPGEYAKQPLRLGQVSDVMLHPEHRAGLGQDSVYQCMNRAFAEHVHGKAAQTNQPPLYLYGFPGRTPANLGIRIGVYRRLHICTEHRLPQLPGPAARWWQRHAPGALRAQRCDDWNTPVLDTLWEQYRASAAPDTPCLHKTGAYLRWRYAHHPQQHANATPLYQLWLLTRAGHSVGWLITRSTPTPTIVDSCLVPIATPRAALNALHAAAPADWVSWLPFDGAHRSETPIHAVEIMGRPFHPHWPAPLLQPGDTDVY